MRQGLGLLAIGLRSVRSRLGTSAVLVVGTAGAVAIQLMFGALTSGLDAAIVSTGAPNRALVLRAGSDVEITSRLSAPDIARIESLASGVGVSVSSREIVRTIRLKVAGGFDDGVMLRGVSDLDAVVGAGKVVEGRAFKPGSYELVVGRALSRRTQGLGIGAEIPMRGIRWRIVGIVSSGDLHESELLGDVDTLRSFYASDNVSVVRVTATTPTGLDALAQSLASSPDLQAALVKETDYYRAQSGNYTDLLRVIGRVVGGIMVAGALIGCINAAYIAFLSRRREIAILRAMGFGPGAILGAFVTESAILTSIGGLLAALAGYAFLDGRTASTVDDSTAFGQVAFDLSVTPALVVTALVTSVIVGVLGGALPALRASRLDVAKAMRPQ